MSGTEAFASEEVDCEGASAPSIARGHRTFQHEADAIAAEVVAEALVAHGKHADAAHDGGCEGFDFEDVLAVDGFAELIAGKNGKERAVDAAFLRVIVTNEVIEITIQIRVISCMVIGVAFLDQLSYCFFICFVEFFQKFCFHLLIPFRIFNKEYE